MNNGQVPFLKAGSSNRINISIYHELLKCCPLPGSWSQMRENTIFILRSHEISLNGHNISRIWDFVTVTCEISPSSSQNLISSLIVKPHNTTKWVRIVYSLNWDLKIINSWDTIIAKQEFSGALFFEGHTASFSRVFNSMG